MTFEEMLSKMKKERLRYRRQAWGDSNWITFGALGGMEVTLGNNEKTEHLPAPSMLIKKIGNKGSFRYDMGYSPNNEDLFAEDWEEVKA